MSNHLGTVASAGEGIARSLVMSGVPWRFPQLRFAFLEGGHLSEEDFRDFAFANPLSLWQGSNPDFFCGTAVEEQVTPASA